MLQDKLKTLKNQRNYTNAYLADLANLPVDTVNKIISGKTQNPNMDTLRRLASALECTVDDLISDGNQEIATGDQGMEGPMNTHTQELKEIYEGRIQDLWTVINKITWEKRALYGAVGVLIVFILYLFADGMHGNWGFFQYPT